MRRIIEGKLYDTDISDVIHRAEEIEGYVQTLYRTDNGGWFYVNEFANGWAEMHSFEDPCDVFASWARGRGFKDYKSDGAALIWLERHGGVEQILNRWPHRVTAG